MIERYVVRNRETGWYLGERWQFWVGDEERARLYKSKGAASCSMTRKRLNKAECEIVPVGFTFSAKDKWKVPNLNGVATMEFHTVVDYMRNMLTLDITGNSGDHYQMSFNILDVFFHSNRFLPGMPNGSTFIISEKTFAEQPAHIVMVGNEILRLFGFEEDGRRLAAFTVDWWDGDNFVAGY
jgi:hypothetical protein